MFKNHIQQMVLRVQNGAFSRQNNRQGPPGWECLLPVQGHDILEISKEGFRLDMALDAEHIFMQDMLTPEAHVVVQIEPVDEALLPPVVAVRLEEILVSESSKSKSEITLAISGIFLEHSSELYQLIDSL